MQQPDHHILIKHAQQSKSGVKANITPSDNAYDPFNLDGTRIQMMSIITDLKANVLSDRIV